MSFLQAIILGIIQGITEFLPISSSGHLVLTPALLGWHIPPEQIFPFDVLVQWGTLVAVIVYFWKDLWQIFTAVIQGVINKKPFEQENAKLGWLIVLATLPAVFAGILFKDMVESTFNSPIMTSVFLFVTAVLLFLSEARQKQMKPLSQIKWLDALTIGLFQMLAIFPGISRSGSTIAGGIFRNFNRKDSAKFSFLMSIPVMIGAGLFSLPDLFQIQELSAFLPNMLVGFLTAMVVGYISIQWLLKFLTKNSLKGFAVYCIFLGLIGLLFYYI
ncbi:MAG: undecaprenyl-diphosphatase UppP [Anaerolineaceae bacterium]|nr:undecaprenyl-diphosphatase UppP [Anaerolineaceae bacterium]